MPQSIKTANRMRLKQKNGVYRFPHYRQFEDEPFAAGTSFHISDISFVSEPDFSIRLLISVLQYSDSNALFAR